MIKAIIFDMNGVIIDDEHIHELAFRETVKPFGIALTHQGYLKCCSGKTDRDGYQCSAEKFGKALPIEQLLIEKNQMYLKLFPTEKKTYLGVIELIHALSAEYILALTSGSVRAEVELITREFGIHDSFKIMISAEDVHKGKPDPEPYLITIAKLGAQSDECVVIEDTPSGVRSAKAAGCFCIGVTTTHTSEDLKEADVVVDKFEEINEELLDYFLTA